VLTKPVRVEVTADPKLILVCSLDEWQHIPVPAEVFYFIVNFDANKAVQSFAFDLQVPAEALPS
jgi:hypothetical protein